MRHSKFSLIAFAILSIGFFAFTIIREGGIMGRVLPAQGANEIMAIKGTDTLRSQINNGAFIFSNVKKGTYTIWVKANAPYKDLTLQNVAVIDSATTDVGKIQLVQ